MLDTLYAPSLFLTQTVRTFDRFGEVCHNTEHLVFKEGSENTALL